MGGAADAIGVTNPILSVIDDFAVDPHAAASVLHRLSRRANEGFLLGIGCVASALVFWLIGNEQVVLPAIGGSLGGAFVGLSARGQRGALLVRLVGQRSAYSIPAVAKAAQRFAGREQRQQLARDLARLVYVAQGLEPQRAFGEGLSDRLEAHADDLLGLAYLLARSDVKVHPASVALLDRLLHLPGRSPLFARQIPEQHLRIAILRLRSSIGS